MNETETIEVAKAYVALSNAHRLELILPMLSEQAIYYSPHVGEFKGRDAIGEMMTGFFSRFPDVRWTVLSYACTQKGVVEFDFEMSATEALNGKKIGRSGKERIELTDEGHIIRLEVKA